MPPDNPDAAALWDMLTYAREIVESLHRIPFERYLTDRNLVLATERRIEIIGEAARQVSRAFQQDHPQIPWRKIIAERHVLAHDYGEIKQEILYRIATVHIPELIDMLQPLVPPPPNDEE
jgi:uncharacterized protein with HEPN domain